jgi:hypothetical protein
MGDPQVSSGGEPLTTDSTRLVNGARLVNDARLIKRALLDRRVA